MGRLRTWLDRPAPGLAVPMLALAILAAPAWLLADELGTFALFGDDFAYIAEARDARTTWDHLLTPHNTHVVPLFRIWTAGLVAMAGRLDRLPAVIGAGSYLGLVAAMLLTGRFVAMESRRPMLGLGAMAALGISTVVRPAVVWYSAGQALWAGTAVVITLLLARGWSLRGGGHRLAATALSALAAPAIWSGGLIAGPVAALYLLARDPRRSRRAAALLIGVAGMAAGVILVLSRREVTETKIIWERHPELWPRPIQAALHGLQATAEALVFGGLGLDVETTPFQAMALVAGMAALWWWSRGGLGSVSPLEVAGASIMAGGYYLTYVFRGNLPFSSLREVAWYHAIPALGAVLFGTGWWDALAPRPSSGDRRPSRRAALGVAGLTAVVFGIQAPRVERSLIREAPRMTPTEAARFPIPELQRLRAGYFRAEARDRQVRALSRLEKVPPIAGRLAVGEAGIRRVFGRLTVPGLPDRQLGPDALGLLTLPADDPARAADPIRVHAGLDDLLRPEPWPRPPWLAPDDPWPPG